MESFGTFQKLLRRASAKTDYAYDVNGNLTKDLNKDIGDATVEGIVYNHLNLPWQVTVKSKGTITYLYDVAGNKLEKKVAETSPAFSAACSLNMSPGTGTLRCVSTKLIQFVKDYFGI